MAESGARWMLAGGFAMAAWGSTRTTVDLDLVVEESARATVRSRLADAGFATDFDCEGFTNLSHLDPELGRLDIIWVEGSTRERLFRSAKTLTGPDSQPCLVPAPEHLVAMKLKAVKNQPTRVFRDGEDLRLLLSLPGIDDNAVREAFERTGLLELFHRLRPSA
jgi:hypothetical protein